MIEKILEQYIPERFVSDARYRRGHIRVINPLPGTRVLGLHIRCRVHGCSGCIFPI